MSWIHWRAASLEAEERRKAQEALDAQREKQERELLERLREKASAMPRPGIDIETVEMPSYANIPDTKDFVTREQLKAFREMANERFTHAAIGPCREDGPGEVTLVRGPGETDDELRARYRKAQSLRPAGVKVMVEVEPGVQIDPDHPLMSVDHIEVTVELKETSFLERLKQKVKDTTWK